MIKDTFLPILKEISDKLEEKVIDHEIPYMHFDKKDYDYINIIVPTTLDARHLSTILNVYEVKEKDNVIVCKYKDFEFHFIKTDLQLWQFTFYYYCWAPLSNLLATTADCMGLTYDRYGLRYKYDEGSILISINLQAILDFFGLPLKDYIVVSYPGPTGFATEEIIFSYFCMNNYFNPAFYTVENLKKNDEYYDLNKKVYERFLKYIEMYINFEEEIQEPFYYYYIVDEFFPETNFMRKVYKQITKKDLPDMGDINEIRNSQDFDNMSIRSVLQKAMDAEVKYKKQLEEKRKRRKDSFKGMLDEIKKNPKFIWED